MTNNTIPNVPRELLELSYDAIHALMGMGIEGFTADRCKEMRHILSAPSPAGVDGLEVETFLHTLHMELGQTEQFCSKWKGDPFGVAGVDYSNTYSVTSEPLCRLSDAQAIIDGLRGEVAALQVDGPVTVSAHSMKEFRQLRDQHTQRIGELEGLLRDCENAFADIGADEWCERIDAALSAGKEVE